MDYYQSVCSNPFSNDTIIGWKFEYGNPDINTEMKLEMVWSNLMKYSWIKVWTSEVCHLKNLSQPSWRMKLLDVHKFDAEVNEKHVQTKRDLLDFWLDCIYPLPLKYVIEIGSVLLKAFYFCCDSFLSFVCWLKIRRGDATEPNDKKVA